jgi:D-beta-D-heptose 7-phosphate kinase/D-beta-D-heptose 1-phosphate adenosyltransferase
MSKRKRILVLGDVMVDQWIEGPMTRISPEAPSPVIQENTVIHQPGGAANVAANIAALGNPVLLCGVVGKDWEASWLRQWLTDRYEMVINLVEHPDAPTTRKTRITSGGQQIVRVDREAVLYSDETEAAVLGGMQVAIQQAYDLDIGMIVVADYKKGAVTQGIASSVLLAAAALSIPVFVDTKPAHLDWYRGASLLKPNFKEASEMCENYVHPGMWLGGDEGQAMVMASELHRRGEFGSVVITRGAHGATGYDGQQYYNQAADAKEVYDVTGAGDTFMAVLAHAAVHGQSLPEAMRQASMASTLAVQHHHTFVIDQIALDEELLRRNGKVLPLEYAVRYVNRQREAGRTIVMTNGKFCYLHHGHLESFRWAKQQGDFLVVAVNSDKSLELQAAPFMPEKYRTQLIAQQPCVDLVVLFDDADVEGVVHQFNPNVLVKGAQYASATVPGADYVARHGGEMRFAPMINT